MNDFERLSLDSPFLTAFAERNHKVTLADLAVPEPVDPRVLDGFPRLLAAQDLRCLVEDIAACWVRGAPVVLGLGGHVIKTGLGPLVALLVMEGKVNAVAMNGGAAIHDLELALFGATSEYVEQTMPLGRWGMVRETGDEIAAALRCSAAERPAGVGPSLGSWINRREPTAPRISVLAAADSAGVPATVHLAAGTDTVHFHPAVDVRALVAEGVIDLEVLGAVIVRSLDGGAFVNCGSAVILPEIFAKLVNLGVAKRVGGPVSLTTANFDMVAGYRPVTNVVRRPPTHRGGYNFIGQHEIVLCLFLRLLLGVERL